LFKVTTSNNNNNEILAIRKPSEQELQLARKMIEEEIDDIKFRVLKMRHEFHVKQMLDELIFATGSQHTFTLAGIDKLITQDLGLKLISVTNLPAALVKEYMDKNGSVDQNLKDLKTIHKFAEANGQEVMQHTSVLHFICEKPIVSEQQQQQQSTKKPDALNAAAWLKKFA